MCFKAAGLAQFGAPRRYNVQSRGMVGHHPTSIFTRVAVTGGGIGPGKHWLPRDIGTEDDYQYVALHGDEYGLQQFFGLVDAPKVSANATGFLDYLRDLRTQAVNASCLDDIRAKVYSLRWKGCKDTKN